MHLVATRASLHHARIVLARRRPTLATASATPTPATTAKKAKRQRDALGDRAHERRYAPMSQQAQYFTKVQRAAPTAKSTELASQKASAAAMALWNDHETRVQAAAKLIPVDHGHIDLSLPVLVAAESG